MRRALFLSTLLFAWLAVTPLFAQETEATDEATEDAGPEEAFEGLGVELAAEPVFWAALQAFQGKYDVRCQITDGAHEGDQDAGGSYHATWTCLSNTEGNADTWEVQVTGWWNTSGLGVASIIFSAGE